MSQLFTTSDDRLRYWLVGSALLWLLLPAKFGDMMFSSELYAPNPVCDSLGPLIWEMQAFFLPWTAVAAILSAIVALALLRRREAG